MHLRTNSDILLCSTPTCRDYQWYWEHSISQAVKAQQDSGPHEILTERENLPVLFLGAGQKLCFGQHHLASVNGFAAVCTLTTKVRQWLPASQLFALASGTPLQDVLVTSAHCHLVQGTFCLHAHRNLTFHTPNVASCRLLSCVSGHFTNLFDACFSTSTTLRQPAARYKHWWGSPSTRSITSYTTARDTKTRLALQAPWSRETEVKIVWFPKTFFFQSLGLK